MSTVRIKLQSVEIDKLNEVIDRIKSSGVGGVHIMPVGRTNTLKRLVELM